MRATESKPKTSGSVYCADVSCERLRPAILKHALIVKHTSPSICTITGCYRSELALVRSKQDLLIDWKDGIGRSGHHRTISSLKQLCICIVCTSPNLCTIFFGILLIGSNCLISQIYTPGDEFNPFSPPHTYARSHLLTALSVGLDFQTAL